MKHFICTISKFVISVILACSIIIICFYRFVPAQYSTSYNASIVDKIDRLNSLNSPKIILVGNSNLAFGINSEKLQDAMKMPVVNMGLHGGVGNRFLEETAKSNIGQGDLVIICHTDYSDNGQPLNPYLLWMTVENHKELWKILSLDEILYNAKGLDNYIIRATISYITKNGPQYTGVYSRSSFNIYGDNIASHNISSTYHAGENDITVPTINDTCVTRINEFNEFCKNRGATLLIAAYPIDQCQYTPPKVKYIQFQEELSKRVSCPIISDFTDYFIPEKYFYNTVYHLNEEGANIRTRLLIQDIQRWQSNQIHN